MSRIAKLLLVSTSFSPILFTYSFVLYITKKGLSEILPFIITAVMLVIICFCLLKFAERQFEREKFKINSIRTADGEVLGFMVAYLLPILSLTNPSIDIRVIVFIAIIFFIIVWTTNSYHINPLLTLIGYHFYEVSTIDNVTYLLLTRRELKKTASVDKIVHLTEYMILDAEEK